MFRIYDRVSLTRAFVKDTKIEIISKKIFFLSFNILNPLFSR